MHAFYYGLEQARGVTFDYLVKLDCDLELPHDYFDTYRSHIRSVTVESVRRAAEQHLHPAGQQKQAEHKQPRLLHLEREQLMRRYRLQDEAQPAGGLYESFYFRGTSPDGNHAFWLKHNMLRHRGSRSVRILLMMLAVDSPDSLPKLKNPSTRSPMSPPTSLSR